MKILLIIAFCIISGPVGCIDVIGYSGGTISLTCRNSIYGMRAKFFCKAKTRTKCVNMIYTRMQHVWVQKDRYYLHDDSHELTAISRQLSSQDTGSYKCGEADVWDVKIDLKVKRNQCCMEPKRMNTSLGKTANINFNYPPEYEGKTKIFFKLFSQPSSGGKPVVEVVRTNLPRGRFSISDDRESKDLSVRISNVREDDGGVYYCGVWNRGESLSYYSLFKEINLQVTVEKTTTEDPKRKDQSVSSDLVVITVCVCVTVLLIGGSALIYKVVHNKTQGSVSSISHARTNRTADRHYENASFEDQNIVTGQDNQDQHPNTTQSSSAYLILNPNTNQSHSGYQTLNPNTNQSHSGYQTLNPTSTQSHSAYQNLNPNSNQSHSGYQTLNPNTIQSHSGYQTLNPNTIQSHSGYQTLNPTSTQSHSAYQNLDPNTNQSRSGYQTLNPNTIQSHSGYQTLNPNTIQSHSGYQTLNPNTIQSHSGYQTLNPNTNQSHSGYQTLNPNTIQSRSGYQTLNPNTIQSHSGYQTLNPTSTQSHSAYQNLNPNTNQSRSGYQTLNPNTIQSHSGYQTLNPNTIQSHSAYQNLNPNTNQSCSGYQTLNPNTKQPNSEYLTLNPNTNQSRLAYQNLNISTTQLQSAYQILKPSTTNHVQHTRL
ncbi:hypothetical protein AOLI_G00234070 [Acnodon oligacanthus]